MAAAKKKKKTMRLLLLVLVLAALVGVYFLIGGEDSLEEIPGETSERVDLTVSICPLESSDIVKVAFENSKFNGTVVRKEDGTYYLEEEPDFPLNQDRAALMFGNVVAKAESVVAENADLAVYGLENPAVRIRATAKDGTEYRLNVGNKIGTVSENGFYACIDGQNTVYLVSASLYVYFNLEKAAWIRYETTPKLDTSTIVRVEVESEEFEDLAIYHTGQVGDGDGNPNTGNWRMEVPYSNVLGLNDANVTALIENYSTFSFGNPVDYKEENLDQYGLAEPVTKLTVFYEVSSDLTSDMLKQKVQIYIGNPDGNGNYYVRLPESSRVYLMTGVNVRSLVAPDIDEMVEKRFSLIYIYTIEELEVTIGETKHLYEMTHTEIPDETGENVTRKSTFVVDGVPVSEDSSSFNTFYTNFVKPTASWILPADTKAEGEPVMTLRYQRTESAYGDLFIEYFPYDDSFYATRINGTMMYAVDKRDIDAMIENINAYVPD